MPIRICKYLNKFANSSIDISDGLFADLKKLINDQKLGFVINLDKIPISTNLSLYLKKNKKKKINVISKGDDYQVAFTSSKENRIYIKKFFKRINQKVSRIGKITNQSKLGLVINHRKVLKPLNNDGYLHKF